MTLSNGKDTITLTDEVQISAYKSSGYVEVQSEEKKSGKRTAKK